MIAELGHFALILALCMAVIMAVVPLLGSFNGNLGWMNTARPAAWGMFTFLSISFGALTYAFLTNDFSVVYAAQHSNTNLPTMYKISAVWSAHEGSLLLWALILGGWSAAVAHFSRNLPAEVTTRVLSVMGMVSIGFLLFILLTSNPFIRVWPAPFEGRSLNPLLQDPGLAIHPPLLYMGYVGLSVSFSFAIAALIGGRLDGTWARWSRPWTTVAWVFLTLGIVLGSWWAYDELGWGGWWFWDPVENASFMPWLVATGLIHSLAMTEKRGAFKSWTVLLAILGFSLSLLGTFLVRSGVLTSVHAFASDPARGLFILIFLCVVIGGSLALYAWRGPSISRGGNFDLLSRETFLLANNVILVVVAGLILLGTLAPLIYEALDWGKISVGFPWFNAMFGYIMPLLVVLIGIGAISRWKHNAPTDLLRQLGLPFVLSLIVFGLFASDLVIDGSAWVGLGTALAFWLVAATWPVLHNRIKNRRGLGSALSALAGQTRSFWGMVTAHLGVAVFIIGITYVQAYGEEKDIRMAPGDEATLQGYTFRFEGVSKVQGPNYVADRGTIRVFEDGSELAVLTPEKRIYQVQTRPMTDASVDVGFTRDLYVSLGEPIDGRSWSLRLYYKPFVRWIWAGGAFMALGGLLAASDRRYRVALRRKVGAPTATGKTAEGHA